MGGFLEAGALDDYGGLSPFGGPGKVFTWAFGICGPLSRDFFGEKYLGPLGIGWMVLSDNGELFQSLRVVFPEAAQRVGADVMTRGEDSVDVNQGLPHTNVEPHIGAY